MIDERKVDFGRGDFLDPQRRSAPTATSARVAVGDEVEVGSTVQFQVRDADSADEDLRALLAGASGAGALVFTCNGRGTRLFGEPDHDAERGQRRLVGPRAVAGMFCAGEIGPIGGRNFVHGFTASVLLFDR